MSTLIIGFGYKARQGKDSAARFIHEAYPAETKIYGFSDALYAYCRVAHGMRQKDPRLLQIVGEHYRQIYGEQFWVDILMDQIRDEAPRVALVQGMRHLSEADACDLRVRVRRVYADGSPWVALDRDPNHISEIALDGYGGWTHDLLNEDGRFAAFQEDVLDFYREVRP